MEGDHITAVTLENLQTGDQLTIQAHYVLDAGRGRYPERG
jgi:hypothetical protein